MVECIAINFKISFPGCATPSGKPWGRGRSYSVMADADNNIGLFRTDKTAADTDLKNTFGFSLDVEFSWTTGVGNNRAPLNENLVGPGSEWGVGSGPFGYSNTVDPNNTYRMHSVKLGGKGIDFGITRWKTHTTKIK